MKKAIMTALLAAVLLLSACGGEESAAYTAEDVQALLDAGVFTGEMEPVDGSIAAGLFGLDASTVEEITCYMAINTSVSADTVAVFVLTDEEAAQAAVSACESVVASRIESSAQDGPDQVPTLEDAVVSRQGSTVLLAVGETEPLAAALEELS